MKTKPIIVMLNEQISKEMFSAYLYLAISNYYAEQNLDGFAHWFEIQAHEELDHMMLLRRYLMNRGEPILLESIQSPGISYTTPDQGLSDALVHEQMITQSINAIYAQALSSQDFQTTQLLDWFVKEQGEEEKNTAALCKKYEMFGGDPKSLYLLNAELLLRTYAPPSLVL